MKNLAGFLICIIALLTACGPSAEEKRHVVELQKQREDSIRIAVETATRLREEHKNALRDSIANLESQLEGMKNRITVSQGNLEVAREKLSTIKEYQFLRTESEKDAQIRAQVVVIQEIETELTSLRDKVQLRQENFDAFKLELSRLQSQ